MFCPLGGGRHALGRVDRQLHRRRHASGIRELDQVVGARGARSDDEPRLRERWTAGGCAKAGEIVRRGRRGRRCGEGGQSAVARDGAQDRGVPVGGPVAPVRDPTEAQASAGPFTRSEAAAALRPPAESALRAEREQRTVAREHGVAGGGVVCRRTGSACTAATGRRWRRPCRRRPRWRPRLRPRDVRSWRRSGRGVVRSSGTSRVGPTMRGVRRATRRDAAVGTASSSATTRTPRKPNATRRCRPARWSSRGARGVTSALTRQRGHRGRSRAGVEQVALIERGGGSQPIADATSSGVDADLEKNEADPAFGEPRHASSLEGDTRSTASDASSRSCSSAEVRVAAIVLCPDRVALPPHTTAPADRRCAGPHRVADGQRPRASAATNAGRVETGPFVSADRALSPESCAVKAGATATASARTAARRRSGAARARGREGRRREPPRRRPRAPPRRGSGGTGPEGDGDGIPERHGDADGRERRGDPGGGDDDEGGGRDPPRGQNRQDGEDGERCDEQAHHQTGWPSRLTHPPDPRLGTPAASSARPIGSAETSAPA